MARTKQTARRTGGLPSFSQNKDVKNVLEKVGYNAKRFDIKLVKNGGYGAKDIKKLRDDINDYIIDNNLDTSIVPLIPTDKAKRLTTTYIKRFPGYLNHLLEICFCDILKVS